MTDSIVAFLQSMGEQDMAQEVAIMANRLDSFAIGLDRDCAEAQRRAFEEVTRQRDELRAELDALRGTACATEQMTLEEAIIHAKQVATGTGPCAKQHAQLAEWLSELDSLRGQKPVAYVNGDELANILDDRSAPIFGTADGWHKTPLFLAPKPGDAK